MLTRYVLILVALISSYSGFCQGSIPPVFRSQETLKGLNNGIGPTELLYGIPLPPAALVGDTYLSENWTRSSVLLYRDEKLLEGYLTRYDISEDMIQFKTKNGVKVLNGSNVKSLVWMDTVTKVRRYLINAKEFKDEDGTPFTGFFEVLSDGNIPLFKKTFIYVKKANYVVQFDVGSRDDVIQKLENYFYASGEVAIKIPSGKKKVIQLFKGKEAAMKEFIQSNSLDISKEHHLKAAFEKYNFLQPQ